VSLYTISLVGCDATTELVMKLTDEEIKIIKRLCEESVEVSTYGCMPTLTLEEGDITDET